MLYPLLIYMSKQPCLLIYINKKGEYKRMAKFKVLSIDYYDEFKCIGNACEDHCCKGWKITVDKTTYSKYRKLPYSEFKNKLDSNINRNRKSKSDYDYAKINLIDKKCPMLSKDRLCEVYMNLGEEYMCHTCRTYPRVFNQVDDIVEMSVGVSCIEAARNLLLRENPIEFNLDVKEVEDIKFGRVLNTYKGKKCNEVYFHEIREFAIDIIQNRSFTIENRLAILGLAISALENVSSRETVLNTLQEYSQRVEAGYYNEVIGDLIKEDKFEAQLEFMMTIYRVITSKQINNERYLNNFRAIVENLKLDSENPEEIKTSFADNINNYYKDFIIRYEYVYENYIVTYMFKTMFPAGDKSLIDTYINLVVQFSILKMNMIGICGYYKEDMDTEKMLVLIQSYANVTEHDQFLAENVHKYLTNNNLNTLAHALILVGR